MTLLVRRALEAVGDVEGLREADRLRRLPAARLRTPERQMKWSLFSAVSPALRRCSAKAPFTCIDG
jgi:hypothetical protein